MNQLDLGYKVTVVHSLIDTDNFCNAINDVYKSVSLAAAASVYHKLGLQSHNVINIRDIRFNHHYNHQKG